MLGGFAAHRWTVEPRDVETLLPLLGERPLRANLKDQRLLDAWLHMQEALKLLDAAGAPPDVGAHLDLAICRLQDVADSHENMSAVSEGGSSDPSELPGE